jgi:hypothetical protein
MHVEALISAETIERLEEQSGLLLRLHQAELAKDPFSPAAKSTRSNMIALRHTIIQIYGEAAALDVTNAIDFAADTGPLVNRTL